MLTAHDSSRLRRARGVLIRTVACVPPPASLPFRRGMGGGRPIPFGGWALSRCPLGWCGGVRWIEHPGLGSATDPRHRPREGAIIEGERLWTPDAKPPKES